jgi:ABC-type uncharacterized transport system involved in gliding motility auxiliary subunit
MNGKSLFSRIGLIAIAVALVISVAIISSLPSLRIDLTEDKLFSLADGTRNILGSLEQPIELMFFYSESLTEDAPQIRSYGTRVQELLQEIVIASDGALTLKVIDPEPFSEDEDLATGYGVQAVPVSQGGQSIYFGLVAAAGGDQADVPLGLRDAETMPLIRPDQEEFLEYEFMKLISKVAHPDLPVVGLMTDLTVDGGFDPSSGQATQQWMVMDIIRQLYQVRRINSSVEDIDEDVDILMLVHPEGLSEQTLYAIDQFVMRGGQIVLFLDPNADTMVGRSAQGALIPAGMSSELPGLLESWGIQYDSSKVLTDSDLALRVMMTQGGRPAPHLGMLGVQRSKGNLSQDDIITSRLETINLSSAGAVAALEGATTTFEPLMRSSTNAMMMDKGLLENVMDPSILFDEFVSADESYVIAARVTGPVASAFPDGRPMPAAEASDDTATTAGTDDNPAADTAADSDADTDTDSGEPVQPVTPHLANSVGPVNIVVFADTDMLSDRMWVQVAQFLGQRIPQPFANNGDLIINTLDNLSGGADLVSIRSRGRYSRPFTRVVNLQRAADDRLRVEESELTQRLADTEQKLAELNQDENGQVLGQITPEIQAEIDQFNAELVDTRRRLRDVQYQLTEDIEQLGTRLKAINTALVPVLLTLLLLVVGYVRSQRRKRAA